MGGNYKKLVDDKVDLYHTIRCGLVHEYTIKALLEFLLIMVIQGLNLKTALFISIINSTLKISLSQLSSTSGILRQILSFSTILRFSEKENQELSNHYSIG